MQGRRFWRLGAVAGALFAAALVAAGPLAAEPVGEITIVATGGVTPGFSADTRPLGIATGPDGNVWFIERGASAVARMTTSGAVTEFPVGDPDLALDSITAGPDGAMWVTGFNGPGTVYRITTDGTVSLVAQGTVTPGFPTGNVEGIAAGPDGNIWVARPSFGGSVADQLVRITPGGVVTGFGGAAGLADDATLRQITVGPDGNLYVTDTGQGGDSTVESRIWRFDLATDTFTAVATAGTTPGFTAGTIPTDIVVGADSNLWFTFAGTAAGVAQLTTGGAVTEFTGTVSATADLEDLALGCDGGLWIAQSAEGTGVGQIWRAATDGTLTPFTAGIPADANIEGITAGPDQNMWFTNLSDPGSIGRVTTGCGTTPVPPVPPSPPPATPVAIRPAFTG
jgi:virginiamycin B lyase